MSIKKGRKLLDEVREVMRLRHYPIHTERTYCYWIKRFVLFHKMISREDLKVMTREEVAQVKLVPFRRTLKLLK